MDGVRAMFGWHRVVVFCFLPLSFYNINFFFFLIIHLHFPKSLMVNWSLVVSSVCFIWNLSHHTIATHSATNQVFFLFFFLLIAAFFVSHESLNGSTLPLRPSSFFRRDPRWRRFPTQPNLQTSNSRRSVRFTDGLISKRVQDWLTDWGDAEVGATFTRAVAHQREFAIWPLGGGAHPNVQYIESDKIIMSRLTRISDSMIR